MKLIAAVVLLSFLTVVAVGNAQSSLQPSNEENGYANIGSILPPA